MSTSSTWGWWKEVLVAQLCPTLCEPMDCRSPGSLCPWDSLGKNGGVGCHSLLRGIFPTQGSNLGLPVCRKILYHLSHREATNRGWWCSNGEVAVRTDGGGREHFIPGSYSALATRLESGRSSSKAGAMMLCILQEEMEVQEGWVTCLSPAIWKWSQPNTAFQVLAKDLPDSGHCKCSITHPAPSTPRLLHSSLTSQGEKKLLKKNQISQVLITKYVGVPHSRTNSFSSTPALIPNTIASAFESLSTGQEWPRRVLLVKQGPANGEGAVSSPLSLPWSMGIDPHSAEREPSFKVYSGVNFYSSPTDQYHAKTLRQTLWKLIVQYEFYEWLPDPALSVWK